jgi:LysM repeat protein
MQRSEYKVILMALIVIIFVTGLTVVVVQTTLTNTILRLGGLPQTERAGPSPSAAVRPLLDTDSTNTITLRSTSIGFALDYPAGWRKQESALQVVISPSAAGFDLQAGQESALLVGIPNSDQTDPTRLLNELLQSFSATAISQERLTIGSEPWQAAQITFIPPASGPETPAEPKARAIVATTSKNEVGYYLMAVAPAEQWPLIEPTFRTIMSSFRFTQQAVLRPTDATPPPTPTATPTPVIYVVQSGDTLGGIAIRYGVTIEALANRNDIEDPRRIRSGQRLIIPIKR